MTKTCSLVLWLTACTTVSAPAPSQKMDAGSVAALSAIRGSSVDSLSGLGAKTLCQEDARRFDGCRELGLRESTEAACDAAVATCRAERDSGTPVQCSGAAFGPEGSCSTTVGDYLACLDAWDAAQSCKNAGRFIVLPDACRGVVSKCPRLASEFVTSGTPPPCPADAGPPRPESDDIYGFDGCRPSPSRFVILGDSIAACESLDSVDAAHCGPLIVANYVKDTVAPDLVVESHAVSGAFMADLPAQARLVQGGPGPVVVWIYILGNNLASRELDLDAIADEWGTVFDYFGNRARFPDGVTFLLNTQYSPYDQCPNPLGGSPSISVGADLELQSINHSEFIDHAVSRPDTVAVDQYPDWLGHGDNANVLGCPHCGRDNTSWMSVDRIHPNALGYAHMAAKWEPVVDRMYGARCHPG